MNVGNIPKISLLAIAMENIFNDKNSNTFLKIEFPENYSMKK